MRNGGILLRVLKEQGFKLEDSLRSIGRSIETGHREMNLVPLFNALRMRSEWEEFFGKGGVDHESESNQKNKEVKNMEVFTRDLEKLERMPIIETHIGKSKDGRLVIHRTVITDIKDVKYYEKVLENDGEASAPISEETVRPAKISIG